MGHLSSPSESPTLDQSTSTTKSPGTCQLYIIHVTDISCLRISRGLPHALMLRWRSPALLQLLCFGPQHS